MSYGFCSNDRSFVFHPLVKPPLLLTSQSRNVRRTELSPCVRVRDISPPETQHETPKTSCNPALNKNNRATEVGNKIPKYMSNFYSRLHPALKGQATRSSRPVA